VPEIDDEESNVADLSSVENPDFSQVTSERFDPTENLTRMQRLRNSIRLGKKRDKNKMYKAEKEDSPDACEDRKSEDDPFEKNSKFRSTFRLGKSKKKGDFPKEEKVKKKKKSAKSKWESDEEQVRNNKCEFKVNYLGSVEVMESRGMEVCESAIKSLKQRAWKGEKTGASLQVSSDGLRVVEKGTGGMLVDQVIEKVSFCAPDRNYARGFAYISRDGASRRWVCHGFMAKRDSGERLSHAVGVAFAVCLERKQARECEGVTGSYDSDCGTFTRFGSFKQGTITERLMDPQEFKESVPKPPPPLEDKEAVKEDNPFAIQRPKAGDPGLRSSMRGVIPGEIKGLSPFKRGGSSYSSLRVNELPSNLARREKSRVSLILEETFENEETKTEINALIAKMNEQSLLNTTAPSSLPPAEPPVMPVLVPSLVSPESAALANHVNNNLDQSQLSMSSSLEVSDALGTDSLASFPMSPSSPKSSANLYVGCVPTNNNESNFILPPVPAPAAQPPSPEPLNPWDLVPDQPKLKQQQLHHSRSNSNTLNMNTLSNPADAWLESLTGGLNDNSMPVALSSTVKGDTYNSNVDSVNIQDPLDTEWVALAKRNHVNANQNPFKAYV